ncbi:Bacteriocin-protection, YdeI or OmpD-Associated [uncultured archaeon]|nr:Bacteriocin-protection, YdeI or OmpD-Associated [uncultured archaeon]
MNPTNLLFVSDRAGWRGWLRRNHAKECEVWLVYFRKSSGKPRVPYNDAVEEALCFGWIDSTVRRVDEFSFAQRFTPRRRGSVLSQANRERIRRLIAGRKMTKAGLAAVAHVFNPAKKDDFVVPKDVVRALKAGGAWKNFLGMPEAYRRIRVAYIVARRRHGEEAFQKSLKHFVKMTAGNKRFGFVRD